MLSTPLQLANLKLLSVVNSDSHRTAALLPANHHLWMAVYRYTTSAPKTAQILQYAINHKSALWSIYVVFKTAQDSVQKFLLFFSAWSGTLVHWGPVWSVTTSRVWWTSSGNCANAIQTSCKQSVRAPRSGLESASTSSDTIAGTAAHLTVTTLCLDVSC